MLRARAWLAAPPCCCFADLARAGSLVALSSRLGVAYTWGLGAEGQLGIGELDEDYVSTPTCVSDSLRFKSATCAPNGTLLIDDKARLWACGDNAHNKLGLCFSRAGVLRMRRRRGAQKWVQGRAWGGVAGVGGLGKGLSHAGDCGWTLPVACVAWAGTCQRREPKWL